MIHFASLYLCYGGKILPNSEDYLDGLLDSISQAKSNVEEERRRDDARTKERVRRRNRVRPGDDFMEKTGISDYQPRRVNRKNLRRALSDSELLAEFEDELVGEGADDFLQEFEEGLRERSDGEEDAWVSEEDSLPDGEQVSPYFSSIGEEKEAVEEDPKDAFMDNISSIVSEAKRQATEDEAEEQGAEELSIEEPVIEEEIPLEEVQPDPGEGIPDIMETEEVEAAPEEFLQAEFAPDELDSEEQIPFADGDTSAKEVPLMDESGESMDLSEILAGEDGELMDIGDLLNADASDEELPEAREGFEQSAESVSDSLDLEDENISLDELENPKGGIGGLIAKIKGIFKKKPKEDGEEEITTNDLMLSDDPSAEELSLEDDDILASFEAEEAPKEKKEKKKKEKKPKKKKEKKEKKPKEPKPKKEKKPRPVDNSPKVPIKGIIPFIILAISLIALIMIVLKFVPDSSYRSEARKAFAEEDYQKAYRALSTLQSPDEEDDAMQKQAKLMMTLSLRYDAYEAGMKRKEYDYALDALVLGYHEYKTHSGEAKKLDISLGYQALGEKIIQQLKDQFSITEKDANKIYNSLTRKDYTRAINDVVSKAGLTSKE